MLRFGAFVPQGWKLELMGLDSAAAWATATDVARQAEAAGYDHLWVYDHVETVPRREPTHVFEAWMMMAALAEITDGVELGQMVTCASYRNAGMLAKQAACVDVASNGRVDLGDRRRVVPRGVRLLRLRVPARPGPAGGHGGDDLGGAAAFLDRAVHLLRRHPCPACGRPLRPETVAGRAGVDRRRRRAGDVAHRGSPRGCDQLAGGP